MHGRVQHVHANADGMPAKVWALDVCERESGVEVVSGSADSTIVRWRDVTAAEHQTAKHEEEVLIPILEGMGRLPGPSRRWAHARVSHGRTVRSTSGTSI